MKDNEWSEVMKDKSKSIFLSLTILIGIITVVFMIHSFLSQENSTVGHIRGELEVYSFDEAVNKADLIAKVMIKEVVQELEEPSPKTIFTAQVINNYKNSADIKEIEIMQQGNKKWIFNDNPLFVSGEVYILFLMEASKEFEGKYWILGEETNFFKIENDIVIKPKLEYPELREISITSELHPQIMEQKGVQFFEETSLVNKIKEKIIN